MLERLSKLVCENLIACPELDSGSGLWEGLWERIIMERKTLIAVLNNYEFGVIQ